MNNQSSRSHSIFTICLERRVAGTKLSAKFHLVDLAGMAPKIQALPPKIQSLRSENYCTRAAHLSLVECVTAPSRPSMRDLCQVADLGRECYRF
jgi:hypothetical protein